MAPMSVEEKEALLVQAMEAATGFRLAFSTEQQTEDCSDQLMGSLLEQPMGNEMEFC